MILSDRAIRNRLDLRPPHRLVIAPFADTQLQGASYDLRLGPRLLRFRDGAVVDPAADLMYLMEEVEIDPEGYPLLPGAFVLATTIEEVELPHDVAGDVRGKSSRGRAGLTVQIAGHIDPGFRGTITLEVKNETQANIILLRPGLLIAQIVFTEMTGTADRPYGHPATENRYLGQNGPTAARGGPV